MHPFIYMLINFYKNKSDSNVVGKTLDSLKTVNGTIKSNFDILSPYVEVSFNPIEYNYCYIPALKRYYFINDYRVIRNALFGISLKIDVLETYKTEIKAATADLVSSGTASYSSNSDYITDVRNTIKKIDFNYTFNKSNDMVLITLVG